MQTTQATKTRLDLLDSIRGATLLSMVTYHAVWDLVYLFGVQWDWYKGGLGFLWQQSICWTFIFLSGFCWPLGRRPLKRGLTVLAGGAAVTLVTVLAMPESRVVFGVLTLLGSCALLLIPLEKLLRHVPAVPGLAASAVLFALTRDVNQGWLGFGGLHLLRLPDRLYHGLFATWLGFMEPGFFSTDYFSLLPWMFLFLAGYFACRACGGRERLARWAGRGFAPLNWIGRYSLPIYLLHQPVLYLCLLGSVR